MVGVYICEKCDRQIKTNAPSIECCLCCSWFHKGCTNLSKTDFDQVLTQVKKSNKHNWTCPGCQDTESVLASGTSVNCQRVTNVGSKLQISSLVNKKDVQIKDVVVAVSELHNIIIEQNNTIHQILDEMKKLHNDKDDKISKLEQEIVRLHDELNDMRNTNKINNATTNHLNTLNPETLYGEIQDRAARSKNIMVYNIKECASQIRQERIDFDVAQVSEVLNNINVEPGIFRAIRIGRPHNTRPRPLKITFPDASKVTSCLKNKRKLVNSDVRITADQTPMQREHIKTLHKELSERSKNGESNLTIKYIHGVAQIISSNKTSINQSKND